MTQNIDWIDWDKVLAFLPLFEEPGFIFGEWHSPPGRMPWYGMASDTIGFCEALHTSGVIYPFDWKSEREHLHGLAKDPEALARADLPSLRKLLTLHAMSDRFIEGHLGACLKSGHIAAILRRVRELTMG